MKGNIILDSLREIHYYLSRKDRIYALGMLLLLFLSSTLDVVGLAALVPVILAASKPGYVINNKYFGVVYSALNFSSENSFLIFLVSIIFIFFLLKNVFTVWTNFKQVRFMASLGIKVISSQYSKYINMPFWFFQSLGTAQVMNDVSGVPYMFIGGVMRPLFLIMSEVVIILIVSIVFLVYQPTLLFLLFVVLAPSSIITYKLLKKRSQTIGYRLDALRPKANNILLDTFAGFIELKLANKQNDFKQLMLANQEEAQQLEAESFLYSLIPTKVIEMIAILALVVIFIYSIIFLNNSAALVGIIAAFVTAAYRLMPSINRILTSLVSLKQYVFALDTLKKYREYEKVTDNIIAEPVSFQKNLSFQHLTYTFPGTDIPVIKDVSFEIKKGEKIGFIGSSGSGKTTLMNILLRFHQEQSGEVQVDGEKLTPAHVSAWHKVIGYVKQDTFLMDGSVKDNITLGDKNVDERRLQVALEQASLSDFVNNLPLGVDTFIGERGSRLSGGQRQRIGIARALYKQTQILLLDEATSALDNETEREVNEAISRLAYTDITILIIAHRITTLRDCDRIYELSDGRITAVHQYEELIQRII